MIKIQKLSLIYKKGFRLHYLFGLVGTQQKRNNLHFDVSEKRFRVLVVGKMNLDL